MKIWEPKCQNLLREKQGIHQQLSDPTPSSLFLQGGSGFSRSSSKLSSLEGVWQPRKGEKEEREERKLEQNEKLLAERLKLGLQTYKVAYIANPNV